MASNKDTPEDVIDLTDSPPPSPKLPTAPGVPTRESLPLLPPHVSGRMSRNNLNEPVFVPPSPTWPPLRNQRQDQPTFNNEIDLTEEGEEDEDDELKQAIALSLQTHELEKKRNGITEPNASKMEKDVIDLDELEDASTVVRNTKTNKDKSTEDEVSNTDSSETVQADISQPQEMASNAEVTPAQNAPLGLLGLDRKAMEAERLARLKRKREGEAVQNNAAASLQPTGLTTKSIQGDKQDVNIGSVSQADSGSSSPKAHKRIKTNTQSRTDNTTASTRPISPPPTRKPRTASVINLDAPTTSSTKPNPPQLNSHNRDDGPNSSPPQQNLPTPRYYPSPTLLQTHHPYDTHPSTPTTTLHTLLTSPSPSASLPTSALLSSFTTNFEFLLPLFGAATRTTKFVFILHTASAAHRTQLEADFAGVPNVKLVFPDARNGMLGSGVMHSKMGVLFYADEDEQENSIWKHGRCRVIVPTGNLEGYDWGENGRGQGAVSKQPGNNANVNIGNLVWVVDLPVLAPGKVAAKNGGGRTKFQEGLVAYLGAQGVPEAVLTKLDTVDFGATRGVGFVGSVAGFHPLDEHAKDNKTNATISAQGGITPAALTATTTPTLSMAGMGFYSLSSTITSLNLANTTADEPIQIDFLTSSLGSLTYTFLSNLYHAASGRLSPSSAMVSQETLQKTMRIYFPNDQTVQRSLPGPKGAGTICFASKWWNAATFPREVVREAVSKGMEGRGLMHAKVLAVRFARARIVVADDGSGRGKTALLLGWYYVGSGNCSESAWGKVVDVNNKGMKGKKVTVRNWETGVVVPVYAKKGMRVNVGEEVTMQMFGEAVPELPWQMPAEGLVDSGKEPWFFGGGFGGGG